jgi:hypothetical protein
MKFELHLLGIQQVPPAGSVFMDSGLAAARRPGTTESASKLQPELYLGLMTLEIGQVE